LERPIAIALLTGDAFQRNNATVYGIIKHLVIKGPKKAMFYLMIKPTMVDKPG
jgi:hypothetical protein